jgi:hypothetical protein
LLLPWRFRQPLIEAAAEEATKGPFQKKEVAASLFEETQRAGCDANKVLVDEKLEVGQPRPHPPPDEDWGGSGHLRKVCLTAYQ